MSAPNPYDRDARWTHRTEPQWTSTPPSEPGWYWTAVCNGSAEAVEVCLDGDMLTACGSDGWWTTVSVMSANGWIWWPVRIQEPSRPVPESLPE